MSFVVWNLFKYVTFLILGVMPFSLSPSLSCFWFCCVNVLFCLRAVWIIFCNFSMSLRHAIFLSFLVMCSSQLGLPPSLILLNVLFSQLSDLSLCPDLPMLCLALDMSSSQVQFLLCLYPVWFRLNGCGDFPVSALCRLPQPMVSLARLALGQINLFSSCLAQLVQFILCSLAQLVQLLFRLSCADQPSLFSSCLVYLVQPSPCLFQFLFH